MRVFTCQSCGQLVFFDNDTCLRCRSPLGYDHEQMTVLALTEVGAGRWIDMSGQFLAWQRCANAASIGCNWLVPSGAGGGTLCLSCSLTRTRPADGDRDGISEWVAAERAKRRLLFQLGQLGLPVVSRDEDRQQGLAFDLLSSAATKVITGHDDGLITLDLAEADDQHRDRMRRQLNEPYRTVLGHFRHEIGHYYWPILVDEPNTLDACRALFGDDRASYAEAVEAHYAKDELDVPDWVESHISHYATMHPYEDWAETFAHYLHILDALQTAANFQLGPPTSTPQESTNARRTGDFGSVVEQWLSLTYGLNQVNQSMGRADLYPFVLSQTVIRKLSFIDHVVAMWQQKPPPVNG